MRNGLLGRQPHELVNREEPKLHGVADASATAARLRLMKQLVEGLRDGLRRQRGGPVHLAAPGKEEVPLGLGRPALLVAGPQPHPRTRDRDLGALLHAILGVGSPAHDELQNRIAGRLRLHKDRGVALAVLPNLAVVAAELQRLQPAQRDLAVRPLTPIDAGRHGEADARLLAELGDLWQLARLDGRCPSGLVDNLPLQWGRRAGQPLQRPDARPTLAVDAHTELPTLDLESSSHVLAVVAHDEFRLPCPAPAEEPRQHAAEPRLLPRRIRLCCRRLQWAQRPSAP
mmetsp:Transcript_99310/g.281099  ORF Transcript_99310/g.281099 Transcript_99310/m.281099 type:complete len:286 (+) Transcript_99310:984-1841(+)